MANHCLSQRYSTIIGRYKTMGVDLETQFFQIFLNKGEKEHILENPSTQNDAIQSFIGSNQVTCLSDKTSYGSMKLSGDF